MKFCALASGSSGNCFYVENDKMSSAILIDAGISAKQIALRLGAINRTPDLIKGIFITHEHSDHIRGADVLARKFKIPVFATKKTSENCFLCSQEDLINKIKNDEVIKINDMVIETFLKSHKAADPVYYSVSDKRKVSIITDLGYACKNVMTSISDSDFLCIEANHDLEMLESGPYPYFLKQWIRSDSGHLSNLQAGLCVLEHANKRLKNIILSHLSKTNNTPELAKKTFSGLINERKDIKAKVEVSQREFATDLFRI